MGKITEYGQCPNTLSVSQKPNSTKNIIMNKIFIII